MNMMVLPCGCSFVRGFGEYNLVSIKLCFAHQEQFADERNLQKYQMASARPLGRAGV